MEVKKEEKLIMEGLDMAKVYSVLRKLLAEQENVVVTYRKKEEGNAV